MDIKIKDIIKEMEKYAPLNYAENWDPVGLSVGDKNKLVGHVVLALDLREETIDLALKIKAQLIITHHPVVFSPLHHLHQDNAEEALLIRAIQNNISIYSAHTNLDVCKGGVSDALAEILDLEVNEWNAAIKHAQNSGCGYGRVGTLKKKMKFAALVNLCEKKLAAPFCQYNIEEDKDVKRVAVFPGSFDEAWIPAIEDLKLDALVTGEIKHHVKLMLTKRNIGVVIAGHDTTERVVLAKVADYLQKKLPLSFAIDNGIDYNKIRLSRLDDRS